jgi:cytochrome c-type protein NapB
LTGSAPQDASDQQVDKHTHSDHSPLRALAHITMAVALGAACVGFFVGVNSGVSPDAAPSGSPTGNEVPAQATRRDVPTAVAYSGMPTAKLGRRNADWVSKLPEPGTTAQAVTSLPGDPTLRLEALAKRAAARAFEGAPPLVPHSIDQINPAACKLCHQNGLQVGGVVAPKMSHNLLNNCTQCHVESQNTALLSQNPPLTSNAFVGLEAPGPGKRAWPGAPPTIPHATWMRQQCASCHGVFNETGLRSSHPWRTNCMQCHAPSANLDEWPMYRSKPATAASR